VGKRLAAVGLIGAIAVGTSCGSGGTDTSAPATVRGSGSPTVFSTSGPRGVAADDALLRAVQWSTVPYPMDCGANGTVHVRDVQYATPASQVEVAVVEVSCQVVAATPPTALFVFEPAAQGEQPRLVQALVNYADGWLFYVFRTSASVVTAAVAGYSTVDVGRSTPDVSATLKWVWQGAGYRLVTSDPSHARFCVTGLCAPTAPSGGS
jgi:hypothetical protein